MPNARHYRHASAPGSAGRLRLFGAFVVVASAVLILRLFVLQVLSHEFYYAMASDRNSLIAELFPERGNILLADFKRPDGSFPAAVNKTLTLVYADPRHVKDPDDAARQLAPILGLEEEALRKKLSIEDDPYEPLKRKVDDETAKKVRALGLGGIGFADERFRYYPEGAALAHVVGFLGSREDGEQLGRYGVEGYWEEELAGRRGLLEAEKDRLGSIIGAARRTFRPARDGDEIILTIDRTVQYVACAKLRQAVERHGADGGAVIIMRPKTGEILAMCGAPSFDPNDYASVEDIAVFNNPATFSAYEPGSIFKPVTMAAALDAGKVSPAMTYEDEGSVTIGSYTIKNSDGEAHGAQTMAQVLENSLNTGTIFVVRRLGAEPFADYVRKFGFGEKVGIELDTEASGDISSLDKRGEIWSATASFGQGISATPIQLVTAFGALANGGKLMKPTVIAGMRHPDGTVTRNEPKEVRQVVTKRAASLVSAMLVRVVENGHGKRAAVPGYYLAGKTGTAQVAKPGGGYEKDAFIGSFVGFAPVDDPAFVMLVKIDRPKDVQWAESSAGPLFGDIARFLLQYFEIPPER